MGRAVSHPLHLNGEETCRKVANILSFCAQAYDDGDYEWVGWPRSSAPAYEADTPRDVWHADADAFSLDGIIRRLTVTETGNKTKVPSYKFLLDKCAEALNYEIMQTSVFMNYVAWSNAPMRKKQEVVDLLKKVVRDIAPATTGETPALHDLTKSQ